MKKEKWPIGIFLNEERPQYTDQLHDGWNPVTEKRSREDRLKAVKDLL
ncbi:MAG: hypothetical protein R6V01_08955 [Thermoplasmatota archaeon]